MKVTERAGQYLGISRGSVVRPTPNKRISHGANRVANPGSKTANDGGTDEGMKGASK